MFRIAASRCLRVLAFAVCSSAAASAQDRPWLEIPYAERPTVETKAKAQEVLRLVTSALRAALARPADSPTREALLEVLRKQEQLLKDILQFHDVVDADVTEEKGQLEAQLQKEQLEPEPASPADEPQRDPDDPPPSVDPKLLQAALAERDKKNTERDLARDLRDREKNTFDGLETRSQAIPAAIESSRRILDGEEEALARERASGSEAAQIELQAERAQGARFEVAKLTAEQLALTAKKSNGVAKLRLDLEDRKLENAEVRAKRASLRFALLEEKDRAHKRYWETESRRDSRANYLRLLEDKSTPAQDRPWYEAWIALLDLEEQIGELRDRRAAFDKTFEEITELDEDVRELGERIAAESAGYDDLPNEPEALGELAAEIRSRLEQIQAVQERVNGARKRLSERVQEAKAQRADIARRIEEWSKDPSPTTPQAITPTAKTEKTWSELRTRLEERAKQKEDLLVEVRRLVPARLETLREMTERATVNLAWVDSRMLWSRSSSEISMESVKQVWRDARGLIPAVEKGTFDLLAEVVAPPDRSIPRRIGGVAMLLAMTAFGVLIYRRFPRRLERLHEGAAQHSSFLLRVMATLLRRTLQTFLLAAGALAAAQMLNLSWSLSGPILIALCSLFAWRFARVLIDLLLDPTSPERILPGDPTLLGVIHRALRIALLISLVFVPVGLLLQQAAYHESNPGFVELWWLVHRLLIALVLLVSLFRPTALRGLFAGSKGTLALSFEQLLLLGYPLVAGVVLFLVVLTSLRYTVAADVFRDWFLRTLIAAAVAFLGYRWILRTLRPDAEPSRKIAPDQFEDEKQFMEAGRKLFFDRSTRLVLRAAFIGAVVIFSVQSWPLVQAGVFTGPTGIDVRDALVAIATFFATLILLRTYRDAMRFVILPRTSMDRGVQYAVLTLSSYVLFTIGLVIVFNLMNVSGVQIAWVVSALAVGIGFGLQSIVRNLVSGIILLIERPVKVGDRVIVGERSGVVERITIRSTTVMTYSNVGIVIPNEELIAGQVINQSLGSPKLRSELKFSVAYGSDLAQVRKSALEVCDKHGLVLKRPAPELFFMDFGDSTLDFELRYWTAEDAHFTRIASDLRLALDATFRRSKIEVPFPQQELHLRSVDAAIFELARAKPEIESALAAEGIASAADTRADGAPSSGEAKAKDAEKGEKMPLPDRKLP